MGKMVSTEELNEIIEVSKKFAVKEMHPGFLAADLESDTEWANTVLFRSREIGLPGLIIPEEFSGVGQSALCGALVIDALASECAGLASIIAYHFAGCLPLSLAGGTIKERALKPLANSDSEALAIATLISPSLQEPGSLQLVERKGELRLSGTSPAVGNTTFATHVVVFIEEDENKGEFTGIVVEKGTPGMTIGDSLGLPGLKVNPFAPLIFDDVEIDEEAIIGERGNGKAILEKTRNLLNSFIASAAIGTARSAYLKAHTYAQERFQYGKFIIHHEEIQRMLGAMRLKLSVGTAAYTRLFDQDPLNLPASLPDAGLAKVYCTESALEIALDAIQVHGGYGYMHEYGVEKIMRDVKVLQLIGGSGPKVLISSIARGI